MGSKPLWQIGVPDVQPASLPAVPYSFDSAVINRRQKEQAIAEQLTKQAASTAAWAKDRAAMWAEYEADNAR